MVVDLLLIGLGITLEPFPLTAFILLLSAEKGTRKGLAFILGWLACLVVVIAAVVLATRGKPPAPNTAPPTAAIAVKLALGVVLILFAVRQWRRMGIPRKPPAWMARLDQVSLWSAAGLAAFLQPWTLVAAAAAQYPGKTLERRGLPDAAVLLPAGHASFLALELAAVFRPTAADARIKALRTWLDTHRDQVIIVISLLLGFWLTGKSIYLLVA